MSISRSNPLFPRLDSVLSKYPDVPFFLLFLGIPLGMGLLYLPVADHFIFQNAGFPRFFLKADSLHFFLGHLMVLAFWIANTLALCLKLEALLAPRRPGWALKWVPLVPAASYYLLLAIYASAMVGHLYWGYISDYSLVMTYLGDLSHLIDILMIPRPLFFLAVLAPLALLIVLFAANTRILIRGINRFKDFTQQGGKFRRRSFPAVFLGAWLTITLMLTTELPNVVQLGHFTHDPIVGFFNPGYSRFQTNAVRRQWEQKDRLAEKTLHRRDPKVHTVVLFVVDALRADHLSAYGYERPTSPFLQELVRSPGCRKIDRAFANGSETTTGVMSILTSKEPKAISIANYTLPDYFHDHGFKTHLMLCGDNRWYNFSRFYGRKIDHYVDGAQKPGPEGINDDRGLLEQIDRLENNDGGRHFFYFHLMSAHELGYLQEAYCRFKPERQFWGYTPGAGDVDAPDEIRKKVNRYDNRVVQADDTLRLILEKLRAKGYLEDYAAVVTADHGQLLGEQGRFGHLRFAQLGLLRVPLIFFGNAPLPGFSDKRFAVQLDIAPTLADWAGLQIPFSWQGQSLLRPRTNIWSYHFTPSRELASEGAVICYRKGNILKYSRRIVVKNGVLDHEALYDPLRDPGEKCNLIAEKDAAFLDEFRRRANEHFVQN